MKTTLQLFASLAITVGIVLVAEREGWRVILTFPWLIKQLDTVMCNSLFGAYDRWAQLCRLYVLPGAVIAWAFTWAWILRLKPSEGVEQKK